MSRSIVENQGKLHTINKTRLIFKFVVTKKDERPVDSSEVAIEKQKVTRNHTLMFFN